MAYEWLSFMLKSRGGWGVGRGDSMWRGAHRAHPARGHDGKGHGKGHWVGGRRSPNVWIQESIFPSRVSPLSDPPSVTVETPTSVNNRVTFPSAPAMMDNSLTDKRHILSTHREKVVFSLARAGCAGRHGAPVHCEPREACFARRSNSRLV